MEIKIVIAYTIGVICISSVYVSAIHSSQEGKSFNKYAGDDETKRKQKEGSLFHRSMQDEVSSNVDGTSNHGYFGMSVALNENGIAMAIGGYAAVVLYTSTNDGIWEEDFDFSPLISTLGGYYQVALSSDSKILVAGAPNNPELGSNSGQAFVFEHQGEDWKARGRKLYGKAGDMFGGSVSLSKDGGILAVGAYGGGYVLTYMYSASTRTYQAKQKVIGSADDGFGISCSLSDNGEHLAVGSPFFRNSIGSFRVSDISGGYKFARTFLGNAEDEYFGFSVSLSPDGELAAAGAYGGSFVKVFRYMREIYKWEQVGIDIVGGRTEALGSSVALSNNGEFITVGVPFNSLYGPQAGRARTFKLVTDEWKAVDSTMYGLNPLDLCGTSVAISSDGSVNAIGCPGTDSENGYEVGRVQTINIAGVGLDSDGGENDVDDGFTADDDDHIQDGITYDWEKYNLSFVSSPLEHQELGKSFDFVTDGTKMVVGGRIKAFEYTYDDMKGEWIQGNDFSTGSNTGYGCYSVGISNDGSHVVVGAANNDIRGKDSGEVKTFRLDDSGWTEIGRPLYGVEKDLLGYKVVLSADGETLLAGAYGGGYARLFKWQSSKKVYEESRTIEGTNADGFGFSLALSDDATTAVVGAPFSEEFKGFIRIYDVVAFRYSQTFRGNFKNDMFGFAVSTSMAGFKVVAGAPGGNYARVFNYGDTEYEQFGIDMQGHRDSFGHSIAMDGSGNRVAIGAPYNALYGLQSGRAYVFEYDDNNGWERFGSNIDPEESGIWCGFEVRLSSNGEKVGMGCPLQYKGSYQGGNIRVFNVAESDEES